MTTYHQNISDPYIHEPKGITTATAGSVYVANGAGSGSWIDAHSYINGYIDFDATTPAYQHSVTTGYTPLNPTFSVSVVKNFSGVSSPNARLVYTGATSVITTATFSFNFKNGDSVDRNLEMVFYKNGAPMNGGHIIMTAVAGEWRSASLTDMVELNTNDYVEIFVKGSDAFTLDVASASLIMTGAE